MTSDTLELASRMIRHLYEMYPFISVERLESGVHFPGAIRFRFEFCYKGKHYERSLEVPVLDRADNHAWLSYASESISGFVSGVIEGRYEEDKYKREHGVGEAYPEWGHW